MNSKIYSYKDKNNQSSGRLTGDSEKTYSGYSICGVITRLFSNSLVEFPLTKGNIAGYSEVTETENSTAGTEGKTVYKFFSPLDFPDKINTMYPFGSPKESNDWRRGMLKEKTVYKYYSAVTECGDKTSSNFCPVSKTEHDYTFYDKSTTTSVKSLSICKIGYNQVYWPSNPKCNFFTKSCESPSELGCHPANTYQIISGYYELKRKRTYTYNIK